MAITVNDIKKLSPQAKALIVLVIVFIIGYLYYFYFLSDVLVQKADLDNQYQSIQEQIKQKERIAIQLDKYKADVEALQENYKIALLKLPDQREIPGLFHSVALAGRDAGIEFSLFEPKATVPKILDKPAAAPPKVSSMLKPSDQRQEGQQSPATQATPVPPRPADKAAAAKSGGKKEPEPEPFYEEIPVKVTVTGNFQNIVHFFEKVAKLPRIVNISDISMGDRKDVKGRGFVVTTTCTVKTYMFVDKKEQTSEKKNEKK
jgi:type IV pilus assembly protein PilO